MTGPASERPEAPLLSFQEVGKTFPGGVRALQSVSFDVARGEFCVLLGRSGAGKSTLLRAVNGLTKPSEGRVLFDGAALTRRTLAQARRRVSMIHQQFNLSPRVSVAGNIISGALAAQPLWRVLLNWPRASQRAKAWALAVRVGLDESHMLRRAEALSGGQQQRVGIARALMLDPDLVLADEPVASLDPKVSFEVLTLLRDAAKERGAAVLCSLHQLDLARAFADRIVAIEGGRVAFDGPPGELNEAVVARIYGRVPDAHLPPAAAPRLSEMLA